MARVFDDWLPAYIEYAGVTEAPKLMHFWAGVSAVASCLRRKVWIDMKRFQWTPCFYIIFVAPPGIIAKSTTADIAMELVKKVPGINFGPDVITWQALVGAFADSTEQFPFGEDYYPMSALTLVASELGNLINPQDRDQINLYINLWDGRKTLDKRTKMSGNDMVEGPWINMLGCTTPHWIADNMPAATVGGGFTSRCVFVYAERKEKYIAYVDEHVTDRDDKLREALVHDLEHIAVNLVGPYTIAPEARIWGREWYEKLWNNPPDNLSDNWMEGYVARKQTHMHKLAMVLSASRTDTLTISADDLRLADRMLVETERGFKNVFSRIGRTEESLNVERLALYLKKRGTVPYEDAYRYVHGTFPDFRDYEGILSGLVRSGLVILDQTPLGIVLRYAGKDE